METSSWSYQSLESSCIQNTCCKIAILYSSISHKETQQLFSNKGTRCTKHHFYSTALSIESMVATNSIQYDNSISSGEKRVWLLVPLFTGPCRISYIEGVNRSYFFFYKILKWGIESLDGNIDINIFNFNILIFCQKISKK